MYVGPLAFREIFKVKPWGGRALARTSNKRLPPRVPVGESWEIADHAEGGTCVAEGPLAGKTLGEVLRRCSTEVLGRPAHGERFPLLLKLLDCRQRLSVQVHPDDATACAMGLRDPGKTEAWYVIAARPDATILAGLTARRHARRLESLVQQGELPQALAALHPRAGDVWLCPAGAVHALGPGVVLLEIQQNSDTTFRLYDWDRQDAGGCARPLHVAEAVRAVNGKALRLVPGRPRALRGLPFEAERLAACDKFVLDRWRIRSESLRPPRKGFEILHVLEGSGALDAEGATPLALRRGRSVLVPACVERYALRPRGMLRLVRAAESE